MTAFVENIKKSQPLLFSKLKSLYVLKSQFGAGGKWRRVAKNGAIKLELGSGQKLGTNGWTTVDMHGADINYDLRKGIPLKDNTVDGIYTSHLFEHIPFNDLVAFVSECHRVLKVGSSLSVCVPNSRLYIEAYMNGTDFRSRDSLFQPAAIKTNSLMDQVNYIAYMGDEHKYLFDQENLVNTLKTAGFADVKLREFDPDLDLEDRHFESIYALATK